MKGRELVKYSKAENTYNRILRWNNEGDIPLSPEDEQIFIRWNSAYKFILQKKFTTEQIAEKLKELYRVSIFTARNDIFQAQALFAGSIKASKKFLLYQQQESIMLFIEQCRLDKSLVHLVPKLEMARTKAIMAMPDEINKDVMPPPQINFTPKQNTGSPPPDYEAAIKRMKERIESDITDISSEDVS